MYMHDASTQPSTFTSTCKTVRATTAGQKSSGSNQDLGESYSDICAREAYAANRCALTLSNSTLHQHSKPPQ